MSKVKNRKKFLAAVLIIVIMAGIMLYSVLAASPTGPYSVMVKYYDSVWINYALNPNTDKFRNYDVPIGGIGEMTMPVDGTFTNVLAHQAYCIDPFVPFAGADGTNKYTLGPPRSNTYTGASDLYRGVITGNYVMSGESWEPTMTHWRSDYYTVTPWAMSDTFKENYRAVMWLIYNGYRGCFLTHGLPPGDDDGESQASLDRLNGRYGGSVGEPNYIDKSMALVATKVAIWRVLTDGDPGSFILHDTVFHGIDDNGTDRGAVFDELVRRLVVDAKAANPPSAPTPEYTRMTLSINANNILYGVTDTSNPDYVYYPFSVTANILNAEGGASAVDGLGIDVYLNVSGPFAGDVSFAWLSGGAYIDLDRGQLPGTTGAANNQQVVGGIFSDSTCVLGNLFLKVPSDRVNFLGPDTAGSELLRIYAKAHVKDVPAVPGTSLPVAAMSGDGVQDWNIVQAFIGATKRGAEISVFNEVSLNIQGSSEGELEINKRLQEVTTVDANRFFTFALYGGPEPVFAESHLVRLDFHGIEPADSQIGNTNTFRLRHDQSVKITGLPEYFHYWLVELDDGTGDFEAPLYNFLSGVPEANITFPARAVSAAPIANGYRTCSFRLGGTGTARAEITVTNGNGEKAVQTGVDRNLLIPVLGLSLGVFCIVGAEVYRRILSGRK
jgi:hypothetical protein